MAGLRRAAQSPLQQRRHSVSAAGRLFPVSCFLSRVKKELTEGFWATLGAQTRSRVCGDSCVRVTFQTREHINPMTSTCLTKLGAQRAPAGGRGRRPRRRQTSRRQPERSPSSPKALMSDGVLLLPPRPTAGRGGAEAAAGLLRISQRLQRRRGQSAKPPPRVGDGGTHHGAENARKLPGWRHQSERLLSVSPPGLRRHVHVHVSSAHQPWQEASRFQMSSMNRRYSLMKTFTFYYTAGNSGGTIRGRSSSSWEVAPLHLTGESALVM